MGIGKDIAPRVDDHPAPQGLGGVGPRRDQAAEELLEKGVGKTEKRRASPLDDLLGTDIDHRWPGNGDRLHHRGPALNGRDRQGLEDAEQNQN